MSSRVRVIASAMLKRVRRIPSWVVETTRRLVVWGVGKRSAACGETVGCHLESDSSWNCVRSFPLAEFRGGYHE